MIAAVATAAVLSQASCAQKGPPASTTVTPLSDHEAHLVVQQGALHVFKDGRLLTFPGGSGATFQCDPNAAQMVAEADKHLKAARGLNGAGTAIVLVGTIAGAVSVYYVIIGLVPLLVLDTIGISLVGAAAGKKDKAMAKYVDALNMHNDAAACVRATQTTSATTPAS
jgi:hypothetical protein